MQLLFERGWPPPPLITGRGYPQLLLFLENGWPPPLRIVLQCIILYYTILPYYTILYHITKSSQNEWLPHPASLWERMATASIYQRVWLSPAASLFGKRVATSSTYCITVYYTVLYCVNTLYHITVRTQMLTDTKLLYTTIRDCNV